MSNDNNNAQCQCNSVEHHNGADILHVTNGDMPSGAANRRQLPGKARRAPLTRVIRTIKSVGLNWHLSGGCGGWPWIDSSGRLVCPDKNCPWSEVGKQQALPEVRGSNGLRRVFLPVVDSGLAPIRTLRSTDLCVDDAQAATGFMAERKVIFRISVGATGYSGIKAASIASMCESPADADNVMRTLTSSAKYWITTAADLGIAPNGKCGKDELMACCPIPEDCWYEHRLAMDMIHGQIKTKSKTASDAKSWCCTGLPGDAKYSTICFIVEHGTAVLRSWDNELSGLGKDEPGEQLVIMGMRQNSRTCTIECTLKGETIELVANIMVMILMNRPQELRTRPRD